MILVLIINTPYESLFDADYLIRVKSIVLIFCFLIIEIGVLTKFYYFYILYVTFIISRVLRNKKTIRYYFYFVELSFYINKSKILYLLLKLQYFYQKNPSENIYNATVRGNHFYFKQNFKTASKATLAKSKLYLLNFTMKRVVGQLCFRKV